MRGEGGKAEQGVVGPTCCCCCCCSSRLRELVARVMIHRSVCVVWSRSSLIAFVLITPFSYGGPCSLCVEMGRPRGCSWKRGMSLSCFVSRSVIPVNFVSIELAAFSSLYKHNVSRVVFVETGCVFRRERERPTALQIIVLEWVYVLVCAVVWRCFFTLFDVFPLYSCVNVVCPLARKICSKRRDRFRWPLQCTVGRPGCGAEYYAEMAG